MKYRTDYSKAIIIGDVSETYPLSYTKEGTPVLNFELRYDTQKKTHLIPVTVFGELATDVSCDIHKGMRLLIEGSISSRDDKFEIMAKRVLPQDTPF